MPDMHIFLQTAYPCRCSDFALIVDAYPHRNIKENIPKKLVLCRDYSWTSICESLLSAGFRRFSKKYRKTNFLYFFSSCAIWYLFPLPSEPHSRRSVLAPSASLYPASWPNFRNSQNNFSSWANVICIDHCLSDAKGSHQRKPAKNIWRPQACWPHFQRSSVEHNIAPHLCS